MRVLVMAFLCVASVPLWGQASSLPEAPVPAAANSPDNPQWQRVESLPQGELVELRDRTTGIRTECVLAYASATAVGCDTGGSYDPARRVVYPVAAIDAVWVVRWVHGPSPKAMLIGAGIGGVVGGLIFSESGRAGVTAVGVGLGALLGVAESNAGDLLHTRMSRRRKRIYRAR